MIVKMDYMVSKVEKYSDQRGDLVVFLKNKDLQTLRDSFGQIYFITFTSKGIIRGNHYHKNWREWFTIVEGEVLIKLEDVRNKENVTIVLSSNNKEHLRLEIGPYIAHSFKSLSESASLLNYADKEWLEKDTFYYKLM